MSKSLKIQLTLVLIFFITLINTLTAKEIKNIREKTINKENIQKSKRNGKRKYKFKARDKPIRKQK